MGFFFFSLVDRGQAILLQRRTFGPKISIGTDLKIFEIALNFFFSLSTRKFDNKKFPGWQGWKPNNKRFSPLPTWVIKPNRLIKPVRGLWSGLALSAFLFFYIHQNNILQHHLHHQHHHYIIIIIILSPFLALHSRHGAE